MSRFKLNTHYHFILFFFLTLLISSCQKQEEQTANRDAIVGAWDVVENISEPANASAEVKSINLVYETNITRSEVFADEVYIYNFFDVARDYYIPASVDGLNITIDEITLRDYTVRGNGSISSDHQKIEWSYWVEQPSGESHNYKATYTFKK